MKAVIQQVHFDHGIMIDASESEDHGFVIYVYHENAKEGDQPIMAIGLDAPVYGVKFEVPERAQTHTVNPFNPNNQH